MNCGFQHASDQSSTDSKIYLGTLSKSLDVSFECGSVWTSAYGSKFQAYYYIPLHGCGALSPSADSQRFDRSLWSSCRYRRMLRYHGIHMSDETLNLTDLLANSWQRLGDFESPLSPTTSKGLWWLAWLYLQ